MAKHLREPMNGLTHLIGASLALIGLGFLIAYAVIFGTAWHIMAFTIYGVSLVGMYVSSTLYHWLPLGEKGVRRMKRFDHIMIFVLIAGTYTPFCLTVLRANSGWWIFAVVWLLALAGIFQKILWLHAPRWLSPIIYLFMGWLILPVLIPLANAIPQQALVWLSLGGFFYTAGAIIYGCKRPNFLRLHLGFHEIWHLFVMAASACHYWAIIRYLTFVKS